MSNLRPQVRSAIQSFLLSQDGNQTPSDVLRVIEEEAALLRETEDVSSLLQRDPYEQFEDVKPQVERLRSMIQVVSCTRVRARYSVSIDAVVAIDNGQNLQLTFKYEQKPREATKGSHVWYSIEMSQNYLQRENLLVVQVWAPGDAPCTTSPAVCINEVDEEDLWEDMEDDNDVDVGTLDAKAPQHGASNASKDSPPSSPRTHKKLKLSTPPQSQSNDEEVETCDSFMAFMDPDLLHTFIDATGIGPLDEDTAFFLLMTFPFYEHEWDLIGFVLEAVFGAGGDEKDDDSVS
eukprot:scaffold25176_cov191-Cylindrotheca_fusiformis.AAC.6